MNNTLYSKNALSFFKDIPVFSVVNDYIENYEKISFDHVEHYNRTGENPFMSEDYWNSIEKSTKALIKKYAKPGQKILDVGVGLGRLLEDFNELERYGMDISSNYIEIASKKNITCCLSLIEDMPYQENYFDVITCTDVLEHVLDLNLAIKNILKVLKPNGILIIRVPYKENIAWYLSEECPYQFVHLRTFDEFALKAIFSKIFPAEILEWNTAGTTYDYTRLKYPIPPYNRWLSSIFRFYYKKQQNKIEKYRTFFDFNEINYVVRKKLE